MSSLGYHRTLFYIGTAHHCEPCNTQKEQHYQRHKEIAAIVKQILQLDGPVDSSPNPLTKKGKWSRINEGSDSLDDDEAIADCSDSECEYAESSTTERTEDRNDLKNQDEPKSVIRRERKAERKAARNRARFICVTEEEINRVDEVIHPKIPTGGESIGCSDPLKNGTIKENIAFNASTFKYSSLRTSIHTKKVLKNNGLTRTLEDERLQKLDADIEVFIRKLGVDSETVRRASKERKCLITKLQEGIRKDLEQVDNENLQLMKRMAGYWRYVNRSTYNHMVQQNQIWDWATGAKLDELDEEEEEEIIEEKISATSSNSPDLLHQQAHLVEAISTLSIGTSSQEMENAPIGQSSATKSCNHSIREPTPPKALIKDFDPPSPFAGKADKRLRDTPRVVTPSKKDIPDHNLDHTTPPKEKRKNHDVHWQDENKDEKDTIRPKPLRVPIQRITLHNHAEPKHGIDRNNRFSALTDYHKDQLEQAPVPALEVPPESTSRRSSVRRVANPPPTPNVHRPSPLRNATAVRVQSVFPALPDKGTIKPTPKSPYPPAHLKPAQVAGPRNQQPGYPRRGGPSAATSSGNAARMRYADVVRK